MVATFVVEDGTGLADANAYVTVAEAKQYYENHGGDPIDSTNPAVKAKSSLVLAVQPTNASHSLGTLDTDNDDYEDGDTVTIDAVVYTWRRNQFTGVGNEVKMQSNNKFRPNLDLPNLVSCINGTRCPKQVDGIE